MVPKTVLIVDDDQDICCAARQILERRGMRTVQACSVQQALIRFDSSIDLILLDLELPDVSGHVLLKVLRDRGLYDFPVIIMSGTGTIEDVIEALRNQASDYIRKPFFPEQLTAAIDRAFQEKAKCLECRNKAALEGHRRAPIETLLTAVENQTISPREKQIMGLLSEGRRAPEVATLLCISRHTIHNHLKAIFKKMNVHSQADLVQLLRMRRHGHDGQSEST